MIISVLPFVLLLVLIFLGYLVIKNRWYFQALLVVVGILGIVVSVAGLRRVTDSVPTNDTTGIVLLIVGLGALTGDAILIRTSQKPAASNGPMPGR